MNNLLATSSLILSLLLTSCSIAAKVNDNKFHDYRAEYIAMDLLKMQQFHMNQAKLKIEANQILNAWGDLAYLLCHIPNHHQALKQMQELAPQLNKQEEMIKFYENAVKIFPKDPEAHALYALYLAHLGDHQASTHHIEIALELDPKLEVKYFAKESQ